MQQNIINYQKMSRYAFKNWRVSCKRTKTFYGGIDCPFCPHFLRTPLWPLYIFIYICAIYYIDNHIFFKYVLRHIFYFCCIKNFITLKTTNISLIQMLSLKLPVYFVKMYHPVILCLSTCIFPKSTYFNVCCSVTEFVLCIMTSLH